MKREPTASESAEAHHLYFRGPSSAGKEWEGPGQARRPVSAGKGSECGVLFELRRDYVLSLFADAHRFQSPAPSDYAEAGAAGVGLPRPRGAQESNKMLLSDGVHLLYTASESSSAGPSVLKKKAVSNC